jgi:hypothetical protein
MTEHADNELWDELLIPEPPPPPPTRYAELSEGRLIHWFRDTHRDFIHARKERHLSDLREMRKEFGNRGWDEARTRGLLE